MNPSNLDISINIEGRKIRNIFKAIPGRKPWMNDLITFLHEKQEVAIFQGIIAFKQRKTKHKFGKGLKWYSMFSPHIFYFIEWIILQHTRTFDNSTLINWLASIEKENIQDRLEKKTNNIFWRKLNIILQHVSIFSSPS
jgi:hypothetical protein